MNVAPVNLLDPYDGEEMVSTPCDRNSRSRMPGEGMARRRITLTRRDKPRLPDATPGRRGASARRAAAFSSEKGGDAAVRPKRSCLWHLSGVLDPELEPAPVFGAFPRGFVDWLYRSFALKPTEVLHCCSGMLSRDEVGGALRVDLRAEARPDVRADGRALPFVDGAFAGVVLDPPYSPEYADALYGSTYPRPSHLLAEAVRVARPGGLIVFVHFLVPRPPEGARIVSIHGLTQGCGYRIRAVTVMRRGPAALPFGMPT